MNKEKMNKILIKNYTNKMCAHDRELLIRLNKIFIENYETTNSIIDKNESVYLTGKYSKINNYSKLPKNVSDACFYLDNTMNIIYIFTKILQYNCKFFEIDLDYNMYGNLDSSIEQDSIKDIIILTCIAMKDIYITYRSYKNQVHKTTNISKLQHLIFDAIEGHINMYQESQNMYNLTCKLVNKQGNFFNDFKKAFTFTIDIFKDFFKWLKSLFEINNPVIITENGATTMNDILSDSGELYEKLVEVLIYAIDKLNSETIVKLMYRYNDKAITEHLSKEMQEIFSKKKDGELLTDQKEIEKYNAELNVLEKLKDYDKSKIENVMNPSILELYKYMNDGILLLLRGLILFT